MARQWLNEGLQNCTLFHALFSPILPVPHRSPCYARSTLFRSAPFPPSSGPFHPIPPRSALFLSFGHLSPQSASFDPVTPHSSRSAHSSCSPRLSLSLPVPRCSSLLRPVPPSSALLLFSKGLHNPPEMNPPYNSSKMCSNFYKGLN